jgi:hypothetical protein
MARGIRSSGDVITRTADGVDHNSIYNDFSAAVATVNKDRDSLSALFTFKTVLSGEPVLQAYMGGEFEQASEYGEPVGYRPDTAHVVVGYPLGWYDMALRSTWKYLIDASAEQIRADQNAGLEADSRLTFRHILSSAFDPAQSVNESNVPVVGFWSGDGTVPPESGGQTFSGSTTHYLTSGSATLDNVDLADLVGLPLSKGYGADGRGRLLAFAHPDQMRQIRRFRATDGVGAADFIPSSDAPAYLTADKIIGSVAPGSYGAIPIAGSFGPAWVSENSMIPSGYVLVVVSDGPNSSRNPIGFREHPRPELRGLRPIGGGNKDYPLTDCFLARGFGTGVRHRGAGAVMQVTASATYTAPAAYRHGA